MFSSVKCWFCFAFLALHHRFFFVLFCFPQELCLVKFVFFHTRFLLVFWRRKIYKTGFFAVSSLSSRVRKRYSCADENFAVAGSLVHALWLLQKMSFDNITVYLKMTENEVCLCLCVLSDTQGMDQMHDAFSLFFQCVRCVMSSRNQLPGATSTLVCIFFLIFCLLNFNLLTNSPSLLGYLLRVKFYYNFVYDFLFVFPITQCKVQHELAELVFVLEKLPFECSLASLLSFSQICFFDKK